MNHRPYTPATATSLIARSLMDLKVREKLTFTQMAAVVGLGRAALIHYVYGDIVPRPRAVKILARVFQWTPEEVGVAAMFKPEKKRKRKAK